MIFGYLSIGILIFQQIFLNYFYMKVSFVIFPPYNLLLVLCFVSLIRTFSDMQTSFYALRLSSLFLVVKGLNLQSCDLCSLFWHLVVLFSGADFVCFTQAFCAPWFPAPQSLLHLFSLFIHRLATVWGDGSSVGI